MTFQILSNKSPYVPFTKVYKYIYMYFIKCEMIFKGNITICTLKKQLRKCKINEVDIIWILLV